MEKCSHLAVGERTVVRISLTKGPGEKKRKKIRRERSMQLLPDMCVVYLSVSQVVLVLGFDNDPYLLALVKYESPRLLRWNPGWICSCINYSR
jgi:hypothetical protein